LGALLQREALAKAPVCRALTQATFERAQQPQQPLRIVRTQVVCEQTRADQGHIRKIA
jgi:hypothetical protein